jgi:hypothetical protein
MDDHSLSGDALNRRLLSRLVLPHEQPAHFLESAGPDVPAEPVMRIQERVAAAEYVLGNRAALVPSVDRETLGHLINHGRTGLHKLENEGPAARLAPAEIMGLEAIIESDGSRPVLLVQDGTIDVDSPELASGLGLPWRAAAVEQLPGIERVAASVGVIRLPAFDNMRIGTGFAIAPGLILTNRHVLEAIARFQDGTWSWKYKAQIDFRGEFGREGELAFDLDSVLLSGPDPIDGRVDFAHLDVAVIRVRTGQGDFPPSLAFGETPDAVKVTQQRKPGIYVMGFPVQPAHTLPGDDQGQAEPPAAGHEFEGVLARLFRDPLGNKRWAPGYVEAGAGQLADDKQAWVMSHDASTLGGNSGSCVVDFSGQNALVVGLHFGGRPRVENWAHVLGAIRDRFEGVDVQWSSQY